MLKAPNGEVIAIVLASSGFGKYVPNPNAEEEKGFDDASAT